MKNMTNPTTDPPDPDPEEFLRALLAIKPEDAKEVREEADEKARPSRTDD